MRDSFNFSLKHVYMLLYNNKEEQICKYTQARQVCSMWQEQMAVGCKETCVSQGATNRLTRDSLRFNRVSMVENDRL